MESNETLICYFVKDEENVVNCSGTLYTSDFSGGGEDTAISVTNWLFWVYLILYIVLVLFAGIETD